MGPWILIFWVCRLMLQALLKVNGVSLIRKCHIFCSTNTGYNFVNFQVVNNLAVVLFWLRITPFLCVEGADGLRRDIKDVGCRGRTKAGEGISFLPLILSYTRLSSKQLWGKTFIITLNIIVKCVGRALSMLPFLSHLPKNKDVSDQSTLNNSS